MKKFVTKMLTVAVAMFVAAHSSGTQTATRFDGWGDDEGVVLHIWKQGDLSETEIVAIELGHEITLTAAANGLDGIETVYHVIKEDGAEVASGGTDPLVEEHYTHSATGTYVYQAFSTFSATGRPNREKESDPRDLHVIQISTLSAVAEDYHDEYEVPSSGEWTIPFEGSGSDSGRLRVVLISAPTSSYVRNSEYTAEVDSATGEVNLLFLESGPYLVKTVREDGGLSVEKVIDLLYEAGASNAGAKKTGGPKANIGVPSADLILVSSAGNDKFLQYARASINGEVAVGSVADAIAAINAKFTANNNQPFSVAVIDHGNQGIQIVGGGKTIVAGKFLTINTVADLNAFTAACNGQVTSVRLYGCNVAGGTDGPPFLQKIATDGNTTITAYMGSVYCGWSLFSGYYWQASANGATVTKTP